MFEQPDAKRYAIHHSSRFESLKTSFLATRKLTALCLGGIHRVRRSDLLDSHSQRSSSPITDAAAEQELYSKQQLHFDLDFVDINHDGDLAPQNPGVDTGRPSSTLTHPVADDRPSEAFEFEFRLFSTSTGTSTRAHEDSTRTHDAAPPQSPLPTPPPSSRNPKSGIHRIRIRSPTPLCSPASSGDGAFVVPHRPEAYYFTRPTTAADQRAAYTAVAVSSAEVRERADKTRWPGTSLPWRVTHVHLHSHSTSLLQLKRAPPTIPEPRPQPPGRPAESRPKVKTRRTRAGKKRRLAIRAKYAATTAKADTERAKRTRRNREKKVKKKEREKKAKTQAVSGD